MELSEILGMVRPNIQHLKPYVSARDAFSGEAMVHLDANESPYEDPWNRYPDSMQSELRKAIAMVNRIEDVEVLLGNGSDEIIDLVMRAFCTPGLDKIITHPPTYGMYAVTAGINDVKVLEVPLLLPYFNLDIEGMLQGAEEAKLMFVCSPNNPTGNAFPVEEIETLVKGFNGLVVVDEAYVDFSEKTSALSLLHKYDNLLVMRTFSKAWGMAGLRLGALFGSKEILEVLFRIKPPYNINSATQKYVMERLDKIDINFARTAEILKEREWMVEELQGIHGVDKIYPSDANFLLFRTDNAMEVYEKLREKGVIVRYRGNEQNCRDCLRVSIGVPEENREFIKTLRALKNA